MIKSNNDKMALCRHEIRYTIAHISLCFSNECVQSILEDHKEMLLEAKNNYLSKCKNRIHQ